LEQNPTQQATIEQLTRRQLTEGSEVTANSMRPLAAAAAKAAGGAAAAGKESAADTVEREEVDAS
jgi:recombination protein RecA